MIKGILLVLLVVGAILFAVFITNNNVQSKIDRPSDGYGLHIDAKRHITDLPNWVVHHYCKSLKDGVIQCLLFESDDPDAHLIGVETVIDAKAYAALSPDEQQKWHYHKVEIPLVDAKLPDLKPEEAAKVVQALQETYGKVVIFWEPGQSAPIGDPVIVNVHSFK
jgi:hypothetical protein